METGVIVIIVANITIVIIVIIISTVTIEIKIKITIYFELFIVVIINFNIKFFSALANYFIKMKECLEGGWFIYLRLRYTTNYYAGFDCEWSHYFAVAIAVNDFNFEQFCCSRYLTYFH